MQSPRGLKFILRKFIDIVKVDVQPSSQLLYRCFILKKNPWTKLCYKSVSDTLYMNYNLTM